MIKVEHLHKTFGELKALHDISLNVEEGEIVCLIGYPGYKIFLIGSVVFDQLNFCNTLNRILVCKTRLSGIARR